VVNLTFCFSDHGVRELGQGNSRLDGSQKVMAVEGHL
jgi:hypothetical protein